MIFVEFVGGSLDGEVRVVERDTRECRVHRMGGIERYVREVSLDSPVIHRMRCVGEDPGWASRRQDPESDSSSDSLL